MKKILAAVLFSALIAACNPAAKVKVTVSNPINLERTNETVEVAWCDITEKIADVTPETVVVLGPGKVQIPSQILRNSKNEPLSIIFQATVAPSSKTVYKIVKGEREEYPSQVYGRYVPERLDDYAWENNLVAYRLYGPALTDPVAPGIDVWVKSTDKLIINEWFARGNYHHNYGEGMDCYKVGTTLGAGACAPYVDDKLWLSGNYATQECLANGPIRTTVLLTYAPFKVGDTEVTMEKIITLDANTRFNKIINIYHGDFDILPIAAGIIRHDVKRENINDIYVSLTEAASDSKDPARDGDISLAIIMPKAKGLADVDNHCAIYGDVISGEPLIYWSGSGWSQGGIESPEAWDKLVSETAQKVVAPLTLTIK